MILYHGSYSPIEFPDLSFSRQRTDFGRGFYLTPHKEQAYSWAKRFLRERNTAFISSYDFLTKSNDKLSNDINVLEFDSHSIDWLNFITSNRLGLPCDIDWDIVIGGVANDKVFDTLQLYFDGLIDAGEAIGRLRYNKPNYQYCFKKQKIIDDYLIYIGSEELK